MTDFSPFKSEGMNDEDLEKVLSKIVGHFPIELDKPILTMDKPLIIECACPGWQPKYWPPEGAYEGDLPSNYVKGGVRYSAVPCSVEEQAEEIIKAAKLGCAVAHIHPRDPRDCMSLHDKNLLKDIYDHIFNEVDVISIQHSWFVTEDGYMDYITEPKELLKLGNGNKYTQGAVVLWPPADSYPKNYIKSVIEAFDFMYENDIKPVNKFRSTYHVRLMDRALKKTNIVKDEPLILLHDMGHPFGWPMDIDPWMPIEMITSLMQTKERIPNTIIGVESGGRNWLPITLLAIMLGVDFVRVGIEDCYWMYPHKDEVIQKNIDCVEKTIKFCEIIGRDVASAEEARKIMGMKRTS